MSNKLTGLKLSRVKLNKIKPYPENPRVISDRAIEAVAKSLLAFGWQQPLVLNAQEIIGVGHTRFLAAKKIHKEGGSIPNWPDTSIAPVFYANDLTIEEFKAYRIADNKTGEFAEWDFSLLSVEIEGLADLDFDLTNLGFSTIELDSILPLGNDELSVDDEWAGMPEFSHQDKTAFRSIVVHLKDQKAVDQFAETIGQKITKSTRMCWFPNIEIESYADKRYSSES